MKIRNGFVSNSSSSSFVVVVSKKDADEVINEMNAYEQAVINFIKKNQKFMGKEVSVFTCMSGNMDSWEYCFDSDKEAEKAGIDPDEAPFPVEVWDDFVDKLKEKTTDIIYSEESC